MCTIPSVRLNNARNVPIIGLGTWRSACDVVTQAVEDAIDVGYRHLDCAHIYGNEVEVGAAIAAKIEEGVIAREDLFITSKLWNTYHHPDMVRDACEVTLKNLGLTYVDNYLIHWPTAFREGHELYPKDSEGKLIFSTVDWLDTWRAMEQLVDAGLCRAIGISNFNRRQIERLLAAARIPPAILQVECHPYLNQRKLISFCVEKQIALTAYSPLGSGHTPYEKPGECPLLQHAKTQRNNIVITRSVNKTHMMANLELFNFGLSEADMNIMEGLDCKGRIMTMAAASKHPEHPFENEEY